MQLKSTPLVATVTVLDLYGAIGRVRQETLLVYEPLLFLALLYLCVAAVVAAIVGMIERRYTHPGV